MKNKLIPLTQFVNNIDELVPREIDQMHDIWKQLQLLTIKNYSAFLSQPLKLEYFLPCVDGKPVDEPTHYNEWIGEREKGFSHEYDAGVMRRFEEAKSKVLFEGFTNPDNFTIHKGTDYYYWLIKFPYSIYSRTYTRDEYDKKLIGTHVDINGKLENIQYLGLTLTPTALKQIYG